MTDLIGELKSRRLVKELDPLRRPGAGRPTRPISLDGEPWAVLGIHVDVDRIEVMASTVGGRELWTDTAWGDLRHSGTNGYARLDEVLRSQLTRLPSDVELVAVEVGLPGYVARDRGTVGWSAPLGWRDVPLNTLVTQTLNDIGIVGAHVGIATDCHLAALHATRVELTMPPDTVAIYLGGLRNIGSGVIIESEIFRGANGGAGDFGHKNVDPGGRECWCGRLGCLETVVGLPRLLSNAQLMSPEEAGRMVDDQPCKGIEMLLEAAAAGEADVLDVLAEAGDVVGLAIDDLLGALNPHTAILGGYLGRIGSYLMPSIERRIASRVEIAAYSTTTVVALEEIVPRVVGGATLAARDACLMDPLIRTRVLS